MKKLELIITGNEILSGFRRDTNFEAVSRHLIGRGDIELKFYQIVGDSLEDIKLALKVASGRADITVVSGGLGATKDDLTREAASEFFSKRLVKSDVAEKHVKEYFSRRRMSVPDGVMKQTYFPDGSELIINKTGTAFGFKMKQGRKDFFFLPGVPREFEIIFLEEVLPRISTKEEKIFSAVLKIFGLTETEIEKKIGDFEGVEISFLPSFPGVTLRLISRNQHSLNKARAKIEGILGDMVFAERDEDTLSSVVGKLLKEHLLTLACAESLTGGLLQNLITGVPGSSSYFKGGVVAYSLKAKVDLGVPKKVVQAGTVSEECALWMARTVRRKFAADIGISTTGVAGPDPIEGKPPGVFFIGFSSEDAEFVRNFGFNVNRERVKTLASYIALDILRRHLLKSQRR